MTKKMQNLLTFPKLSDPRPPTYITLGTQKFGNFVLFKTFIREDNQHEDNSHEGQ